jgi:hypothetical protein
MAATLPPICLATLLALLSGLSGCGHPEPGPAGTREARLVRPLGRARAMALQQRLRAELMEALEAGGPAGAVRVCRDRAETLTRVLGESARPPAKLKRVTRKPRVPAHAPDEWEAQALDWFEGELADGGQLPEDWVQRLSGPGGLRYRYYQPIIVGPPCLTCHGPAKELPDTVRAVLATLYPDDQATGYRAGDLRGLVRVEIRAEDLPHLKETP